MVACIREARAKQERVSSRKMGKLISKKRRGQPPSQSSIVRAKAKLGFQTIKVEKKPKINTTLWSQRLKMARSRRKRSLAAYIADNERTLLIDEKWFTEEKVGQKSVEARKSSPIPRELKYIAKDAETTTQRVKKMYLLCVTSTQPVCCIPLDFKKWNKDHGQLTKGGKLAVGITADYMRNVLAKVQKIARKRLGDGPLRLLHDRAPCYTAFCSDGTLEELFDGGVEIAAGKAPDMSHLDAGVCPHMERAVNAQGAETEAEIDAAVNKVWKKITPEFCTRVSKRVRTNMDNVILLKGGNFYKEGQPIVDI